MSDRTSWDDLGDDDAPEPPKRRVPEPTTSDDIWGDDETPKASKPRQRRRDDDVDADAAAGDEPGSGDSAKRKPAEGAKPVRSSKSVRTVKSSKSVRTVKSSKSVKTVRSAAAKPDEASKQPSGRRSGDDPDAASAEGRDAGVGAEGRSAEDRSAEGRTAEAATSDTSAENAKPARAVRTVKSSKSTTTTKSGAGAKSAKSTRTTKSTAGAKPAKSTRTTKTTKSAAGSKSTKPTKTTSTTKSAAVAKSAKSAKATKSSAAAKSTKATKSTKSAEPAASAEGGKQTRRRRRRFGADHGAVSTAGRGADDAATSEGRSAESTGAKKSEQPDEATGKPVDTPAPQVDPPREITFEDFIEGTDEGGQQLRARSDIPAAERLREVGAVLRMSEAEAALLDELPDDPDEDQTMIINMGPQHPSTHGVLRLMLELQGETVLRCKPIIGYLHTGMEKTGEQLTYMQGGTNVTRMDYLSPFANELVFSMATEKLLGIDEDIPERATWIRMMMAELNRMSSHLLFMATNGMDLGAVSMMIYGWREREEVLRFFQEVTGLRMNHNYIRPGGVAADLPAGWRDGVLRLLDLIPPRLDEYDILMTGQPIWRERLQGVGVITPNEALALGVTGPILRSTGVEWDLRRTMPYLHYDELDFDIVVGTYGDSFDRYAIRLAEIRESIHIVQQILDRMPSGDYRIQDKKVTPPPRARIEGPAKNS